MGKEKSKISVPLKHLHARISYLQQAANYLALQGASGHHGAPSGMQYVHESVAHTKKGTKPGAFDLKSLDLANLERKQKLTAPNDPSQPVKDQRTLKLPASGGMPLYLASHLQQISRKMQIRLDTKVKHTLCKICHSTLIDGKTSEVFVENFSLGGKKHHADVLVLKCKTCGETKRFPIGSERQLRKSERAERKAVSGDKIEESNASTGAFTNAIPFKI
ncbi:Hypothetical protein R9X50_00076000 [Acrodontium crateriforme]|uniref:Rpr2-domain-containing protein n=1 Tax=Acrodontium crateriforme TaxID=150365 RepID=A0AAQ3LYF5_9PEZI|nr:Hypothetical protein R9X50_00076000 [Acrodontium crateriforme]